jgi:hypothetical protein
MHVDEHFRGVRTPTLKAWRRFWSDPMRIEAAVAKGEFTLSKTGTSDYEKKAFDPAYEVKVISGEIAARERVGGAAAKVARPAEQSELERCFVQFIHPGGEHGSDAPGRKRWNLDLHRRKFLRAGGEYVEKPGAAPVEGELVFWGEWEPESEAEPIAAAVLDGPRWLHTPYYVRPESYWRDGKALQNTDPFVFGDRFLYTLCRQTKSGRPTFLRDLAPGSLILFGSLKAGDFVLDTLFVAAEGVCHGIDNWSTLLGGKIPETYADVTMRPTYEGFEDHELRLYRGTTLEQPIEGMFSFVPCLPAEAGREGFARPSIRLDGFVTPGLMMGAKRTRNLSLGRLKDLWDAVTAQVVEQDLALGTRFELPPRRDT